MKETIKPSTEKVIETNEEKTNALREMMLEAYDKSSLPLELALKVNSFGHYLQKKYPDCRDYRLFHLLIGSTPFDKGCYKFDFDGEDSVEKFIKSL